MKRAASALLRAAIVLFVLLTLCGAVFAHETPQAFYADLESHLIARDEVFTIGYTGALGELFEDPNEMDLAELLRNMAARCPDGAGPGGDYAALNVSEGSLTLRGGTFYFLLDYLTTADQEAWVDREAARLVRELKLEGETDYTKVKLIYEYIGSHFTYDDTLEKFSAYDGLRTGSMVCQGYALLLYKMLWQADVPCRIITGVSQQENHAWNLVELDGKWYHLDVTWDAKVQGGDAMGWNYFLKNEEDFVGHTAFSAYETARYRNRHPLAKTSYAYPRVQLLHEGEALGALTIRKDVTVQLEVKVDGNTGRRFSFVSTGPSYISVGETGLLTSLGPGYSTILVTDATDRSVVPAALPVTGVDLTSCSQWAEEELNRYYLRSLLPTSLCTGFQEGVTRAELCRLLYQFVLQVKGFEFMSLEIPYDDIDESEDWYQIVALTGMGIFQGTGQRTFRPDDTVTREQAAKIFIEVMAYCFGGTYEPEAPLSYLDADAVSDWAREYVQLATEKDILQGSGGSFRPQSQLTLEQAIVILERMYGNFVQEKAAA